MKRFALIMVCLLALSAPAYAQLDGHVGDISAYADDTGSSCNINAPGGGGLLNVYIVHKFSDGGGATGCRFKVLFPATGLSYVTFSTTFTPIGNPTIDLSLGYGGCITTTTNLGNLLFINTAAVPACGYVTFTAPDGGFYATPIATDCVFGEYVVKTGSGIMNPDGSCQCNVATEPTSWGKVNLPRLGGKPPRGEKVFAAPRQAWAWR
jgi:hypothetical protein